LPRTPLRPWKDHRPPKKVIASLGYPTFTDIGFQASIKSIRAGPEDFLVSFDVSLFAMKPSEEALLRLLAGTLRDSETLQPYTNLILFHV
jgi:hypothetical protein